MTGRETPPDAPLDLPSKGALGSGESEVLVDARGLRCPIPVLRLAQALADRPSGTLVRLLATDPAARVDVPALVRMRGFERVGVEQEATGTAYLVRRPAGD